MPISEKAQRAWKAGTAVLTAFTTYYSVFVIDYGPQPHVFTDLQKWYREKLDDMLGINAEAAKKQISNMQQNSDIGGEGSNGGGGGPNPSASSGVDAER